MKKKKLKKQYARLYETSLRITEDRMRLESRIAIISDDCNHLIDENANLKDEISRISIERNSATAEAVDLHTKLSQYEKTGPLRID